MTNIKSKIKLFAQSIKNLFNFNKNKIEELIENSKDYLDTQLDLAEISIDTVESIRNLSNNEEDSLKNLLNILADSYEEIEKFRKIKADKLKFKFISQLEELLKTYNRLEDDKNSLKDAQHILEKAQINYNKEKSKSIENQKTDKLRKVKSELEEAKRIVACEDSNLSISKKVFKKEKQEKLKNILDNIASIEEDYYLSALDKISIFKQEVQSINAQN